MFSAVTAIRFDRQTSSGRTRPCLIAAADDSGREVELVVKFAAGCDMRERSLINEAVAAFFAADLELPVPEPFLVKIESEFVECMPDCEMRNLAKKSLGWNFGSKKLPPGFSTYPPGKPISDTLVSKAAEILAFDVFIANSDRTVRNPNLLFNGQEVAIIDHELAFLTEGIIGWKRPWDNQGVMLPKLPQNRPVFFELLRGKALDLTRLQEAIKKIPQTRFQAYRQALPVEWVGDGVAVDKVLEYIKELKENVDKAINNLLEVLR